MYDIAAIILVANKLSVADQGQLLWSLQERLEQLAPSSRQK